LSGLGPPDGGPAVAAARDLPAVLASHCVCPGCHGDLIWSSCTVACAACGNAYRINDGIPDFTSFDQATTAADVRYKLDQAEFFAGEGAEWEIERPHRAPALYGWMMAEKFRRSIRGLEGVLAGATVLTVCGGSGMDAEFLARSGASVIASDISFEAVERARERGTRHGLAIAAIVADAERLPFGDASVDLTYVHDGLHHLDDPATGLREMIRVAARGVSVTEPVRATVTRLAVAAGLAQSVEEAGNRVERIDPERMAGILRAAGFEVVGTDRYAMFYRHRPGPAMRVLSRRRLLPLTVAGFRLSNRLVGRLGNKGAIRAVCDAAPPLGRRNPAR
jgi:SAM-dependent methyltransferase